MRAEVEVHFSQPEGKPGTYCEGHSGALAQIRDAVVFL